MVLFGSFGPRSFLVSCGFDVAAQFSQKSVEQSDAKIVLGAPEYLPMASVADHAIGLQAMKSLRERNLSLASTKA